MLNQGDHWLFNTQPVMPFSIGEKWNLISRSILAVTWHDNVVPRNE